MADIELVIKIDEEIYKHILSMQFYIPGSGSGKSLLEKILKAIRTGTPLPKGHGRLIDANELSKRLVNSSMFYRGETADMFDTRFADGLREADIKLSEAPVVIESDKGE